MIAKTNATFRLSDLYDADRRTTDPVARSLAATMTIPHPLPGVAYADGVYRGHSGPVRPGRRFAESMPEER